MFIFLLLLLFFKTLAAVADKFPRLWDNKGILILILTDYVALWVL